MGQWHFHQDNVPVHNFILVTDYLTKMGIKTVPQPPYSPHLAPCDFCLFPKLRGCCYETIEEMKEAVTKVNDTLTQKGLPRGLPEVVGTVQVHCSRRRLLRRGLEFHVCTINKSAQTKKSGNLFNDPRILSQTNSNRYTPVIIYYSRQYLLHLQWKYLQTNNMLTSSSEEVTAIWDVSKHRHVHFKIGTQCYLDILSLLDFRIQISSTSKIYTSFYRKPTTKDLFVHFKPTLSLRVKTNYIRNEIKQIHNRCREERQNYIHRTLYKHPQTDYPPSHDI